MRALDLIQRLRDIENRMDAARAKVDVCKSIAEKTTASLSAERVSGSNTLTAHEDAIIRLMEAEKKYDELALVYNQVMSDVIDRINHITNEDKRTVVVDVLFYRRSYRTIAKERHWSRNSVSRMFRDALKEMDRGIA